MEKLVAKFSPEPCPWATSSRNSRVLRLRSKTHRRRSDEGSEKSMTARRSAGAEPLLTAHCMAARAWRRTLLFRVGATFARLASSEGAAGLAMSEDEKTARPAASQSERISLVMERCPLLYWQIEKTAALAIACALLPRPVGSRHPVVASVVLPMSERAQSAFCHVAARKVGHSTKQMKERSDTLV
ncbi:hypothetical protein D3C78_1062650 [compost metagenome]